MTSTHPRTLREALAFLDRQPLVRLTTRFASVICCSYWRFAGLRSGVIWFEPDFGKGEANTGLELHGTDFEVGLTFDAGGFHYHRGTVWVRVSYATKEGFH